MKCRSQTTSLTLQKLDKVLILVSSLTGDVRAKRENFVMGSSGLDHNLATVLTISQLHATPEKTKKILQPTTISTPHSGSHRHPPIALAVWKQCGLQRLHTAPMGAYDHSSARNTTFTAQESATSNNPALLGEIAVSSSLHEEATT